MKNLLFIALLSAVLVGCLSNKHQAQQKAFDYSKSDASLINTLIQQGSNSNKLHLVDFFIECKSKQVVEGIVSKAKPLGFEEGYIDYSEKNKLWSTSLTSEVPLNINALTKQRNKLLPLIPHNECMRVGWGASVVE